MSGAPAETAAPCLALDPDLREVVAAEAEALAGAVHGPAARARLEALWQAVAVGEVGPGLFATLAEVLEISLQTGRARRLHGPESERALLDLYRKTPAGAALRRETEQINAALAGLAGRALERVTVSALLPGAYRLEIATDAGRITLEIDRAGVSVASLTVGM